jgi:hypothetical protein
MFLIVGITVLDRSIILETPKWDFGGCFAFIAKETSVKVDKEVAFYISKGIDNSLAHSLGRCATLHGKNNQCDSHEVIK